MNQVTKEEPVCQQALKQIKVTDTCIVNSSDKKSNSRGDFSSHPSNHHPCLEILKHMRSNGVEFNDQVILDGKIHRFSSDGNKSKKDEWYVGNQWNHKDKPYCCIFYGSWSNSNQKHTYKSWKDTESSLSSHDLAQIKGKQRQLQAEIESEKKKNYEVAAKEAAEIWHSCQKVAKNKNFSYIVKKQIDPHGARLGKYHDGSLSLIIPLHNVDGDLRSLQYIFERGGKFQKRFHYLGEKKGCFHLIGSLKESEKSFICEGYATGCSIHEATNIPVIVAFDCGNLDPVFDVVRRKYPNLEVTIAADNDHQTLGNPGLLKARCISEKYGCSYVFPKFSEDEKMPDKTSPTDFNDLFVLSRKEEVSHQIEKSSVIKIDPRVMKKFFLSEDGLYYRPDVDKKGEQPDPILVSSYIEIVAITRDAHNGNHGKLLRFRDYDGVEHTWAMPLEFLCGDGSAYKQKLLSEGWMLGSHERSSRLFKKYLQSVNPKQRMRCVHKLGWYGQFYIFPEETIGNVTDEEIVFQSLAPVSGYHQNKGTLQEWKSHVSKYCVDNSRLVFCVSTAFAAPLLHILREENGGFNLRGPSSGGKTTALKVAHSVYGGSGMLHSWRATSNGLESLAALHNDCLFCLDELGKLDPKIAGEVAYQLVNGEGKQRCNRSGYAREKQSWKLLFLSSGEIGLPDLIRQSGQKVRGGHEVRVVDIPAFTDKFGVFDFLHDQPSGDAFSRMLCSNVNRYHGTAGKALIKELIKDLEGHRKKLLLYIGQFKKDNTPTSADGQVLRVLNRFAIIAAAGSLATELGITGWPEEESVWAAKKCFDDWIKSRGGVSAQEDAEILRQVRHYFEQHGESRFTQIGTEDDRKTISRSGYRKKEGGNWIYFVLPESYKKDISAGFDPRFSAKILIEKGWLIPDSDGKSTRGERLPCSASTTRCYKFDGDKVFSDII